MYKRQVLEQLDAPGGRAYVYQQDGFTFDAGPTVITAPFPVSYTHLTLPTSDLV